LRTARPGRETIKKSLAEVWEKEPPNALEVPISGQVPPLI
jgi:hypothetical protein